MEKTPHSQDSQKERSPSEFIYQRVNNEKRVMLLKLVRKYINQVKEDGHPLKEAAKLLDINYSTAKTILRVYRNENRILKKSASDSKQKRARFYSQEDLQNISTSNCNTYEFTNVPTEMRQTTHQMLTEMRSMIGILDDCITDLKDNEIIINIIEELVSSKSALNRSNSFNENTWKSDEPNN